MSELFPGGDAAFRIGLQPIAPEAWFEGGEADPARKVELLASHPSAVWGELEGSRAGQHEAARLIADGLDAAPGPDTEAPPLWAASLRVADDLCLMERRNDRWTLTAASLCSPSFFTAEHAVGLNLEAPHGPVPGFEEALLPRVARIFDALRPELILERRNWSVVPSGALFLPDPAPLRTAWAALPFADAEAALHIRMERQTIRRLPETGGVLFTIRIHRHPLSALVKHPAALAAFAESWAEAMSPAGEPFRRYKGLQPYDPAVRAFLARSGAARPAGESG